MEPDMKRKMVGQPVSLELQAAYDATHEYLSDIDVTNSRSTAEMAVNEAFHAFVKAMEKE